MSLFFFFLLLFVVGKKETSYTASSQMIEEERIEEYHRRHYRWPPSQREYIPPTEGWVNTFERRFQQIEAVENFDDKYNGYMATVHSGLLCQNFTEFGWGLTRAPEKIVNLLKQRLHDGLSRNHVQLEDLSYSAVESESAPFFVDTSDLNGKVLEELQPILEAWAGVELVGNNAYGLRAYRKGSTLSMHVDKSETHIISAILHVDHDYGENGDPWPIVIEDFSGMTNEVFLESGDMLLYESSKCLHGRPRNFTGNWYSSLFIHYYPKDWDGEKKAYENHVRIPPSWSQYIPLRQGMDQLIMSETSFKEPGCEYQWCALADSVKWWGPAEAVGKVLSGSGITRSLDIVDDKIEL